MSLCRWRHNLHSRINKIYINPTNAHKTLTDQQIWKSPFEALKPDYGVRTMCFVGGLLRCSYSRGWVYKWRPKVAATLTDEGRGRRECRAERDRGERGGGERKKWGEGWIETGVACFCVCMCVFCGPTHHLCSHTHTKSWSKCSLGITGGEVDWSSHTSGTLSVGVSPKLRLHSPSVPLLSLPCSSY